MKILGKIILTIWLISGLFVMSSLACKLINLPNTGLVIVGLTMGISGFGMWLIVCNQIWGIKENVLSIYNKIKKEIL